MNREIKFRVWDKTTKTMWSPSMSITLVDGKAVTISDNFILMQYTGLKDKNGKEIYEGDILDAKFVGSVRITGAVEWSDKNACWGIKEGSYYEMLNGIEDVEVIGNIYEELLK